MSKNLQKQLATTQHELDLATSRIHELEAQLASVIDDQNTSRLIRRLQGLHQLDHLILAADSLANLAGLAVQHILSLIPCSRISISTIDIDAKTIFMLALHSDLPTEFVAGKTYSIVDKFVSAIQEKPYTLIALNDQNNPGDLQALYEEGIRTILMVPLRAGDQLVGLLNMHSVKPDYFTEDKISIALEVAAQLAIGVHKAALSDALARYARRMEILHNIDLGLIQGGSVKALIASTLPALRQIILCERIGIGIIDHTTQQVVIYTTHFDYHSELNEGVRIPIPPHWFDGFGADGTRLFNNLHEHADPPFKRLVQEGFQSQLQVLLRAEKGSIGVMGFSSTRLNFFTAEHQQIASEVGNQLAIALHQMQLAEELSRYAVELEQRVIERTAELQASKDQIEAILHNSLDGILLIDRDLRIQQANPAVKRLLDIELDSHTAVNLLDLIHPEDASYIRASIEQALAEQIPAPVEVRGKHPHSHALHMELNISYIPGDGLVSTLHDITARKQAEEALQQALMHEKALVEARSRFVSVASHEFRTPLTSILLSTENLLHYWERLDRQNIQQKLDRMRHNVLHMRDIMDDVLQLSRMQSGYLELRPQPGDLVALCREVMEELASQPTNHNRLVYSGAVVIQTTFDKRLMRQVMLNLLSNALKYSPTDQIVQVLLVQEADRLVFTIIDRGIGIPPEDLAQLFEPFHRGSNTEAIKGTGLGLSITRQIIEAHHGEIQVKSAIDQGTTITVILPFAPV